VSLHEPERWKIGASGPYLTLPRERGTVSLWALGNERHRVRAVGEVDVDRVVTGHEEAHEVARVLAERMGEPAASGTDLPG
jgi:hypothetical protein